MDETPPQDPVVERLARVRAGAYMLRAALSEPGISNDRREEAASSAWSALHPALDAVSPEEIRFLRALCDVGEKAGVLREVLAFHHAGPDDPPVDDERRKVLGRLDAHDVLAELGQSLDRVELLRPEHGIGLAQAVTGLLRREPPTA